MKTQNTENTAKKTVLDVANKFVSELSTKTIEKSYTVELDVIRDDYIHIFRNDSNKNAIQCYLKNTKKQVYILANTKLFQDFSTDIEHEQKIKNAQLTRYIVSYDNFTKLAKELLKYDSNRQKTTTVEKVENTDSQAI